MDVNTNFCKVEYLPQHMIRFERAVLDGGVSTPLAISENVRRWDPEPAKDYVQRVLAEDSKVLVSVKKKSSKSSVRSSQARWRTVPISKMIYAVSP